MTTNKDLCIPLTKLKRQPRKAKKIDLKAAAKSSLGRWLEAPMNATHWDDLISKLIAVETQARLHDLQQRKEDGQ